ncbi:mast/stem cell growth factor receptor Kit [Patella vulgata]|uniref:mast/stem cell growth factor receptor Kit n=1 Tax=Patella vulgata TaxID=6465 RepID=UPI00217F867B|nr:mast/stem cell growth factor receptor Kit [Patella vulgata]
MHLQKLTALYLANNQIQEVGMDLSYLIHLQYLYLTGNQISNVHPKSLDRIESLRAIWLNKNNLSGLAEDLSNLFYQINEINLLENPWKCDCHLVWLVRWFQRKTSLLSPTCNTPHPLVSWTDIKLSDMRCAIDSACTGSKLQTSCAYCPAFEYLNQAGKCVCLDGYERPHHSTSCTACVDDTSSKSSAPCTKCENHSSTLSYASTTCSCQPGYTFDTQTKCTACPANTYKSKYGTYPCNPCPRYSISLVGSKSSSHCVCENSSSNKHSYRIQVCLPLISDATDILVSTERQTATMMVQGRNDFQGPMLVGFATFFCCSIIIILLIVYIRRYGNHASRREVPGDRGTETVTLSSADWLDGFAISKDGRYSKWDVPIRKLKIGRLLGKGAFGLVNEACAYGGSGFDNKTFKVAVKRLRDCASEEDITSLKQELEQMKLVGRHPNIISLYGFCHHKGQTMIIMELAELGDLLTYLKERAANSQSYVSISPEGDISEEETKQITEDRELMAFAWQVAKGMSHIESLKCIHRDLAARNVLLAQGPVAKISDFGLSRDVYENGYYLRVTKGRLPFKWLSPEALLWGQFSCKGDVWSYGMLLWEITTLGASPYPGIPADRMADLHRSGYRMPQPPNCPDQLYNIMRRCWDEDPRKRPTFAKLCEVMETILLGAMDRNYLEIQPNPLYSNEPSINRELSNKELSQVALGSDEVLPCLQRCIDSPKYDGSSGYFSQTTGFYS